MKKNLNYISLFIIALLIIFGLKENVYASTKTGGVHGQVTTSNCLNCGGTTSSKTTKKYSFSDFGMTVYTPNTYWYNNGTFYAHTENGTGLYMYCLDATLNGYYKLYAKRFLFDEVTPYIYAQDLATMHILTTNAAYMTKSTALRAIMTIFGSNRSGSYTSNGAEALEKSYFGLAYKWITSDASIKKSYETIYNEFSAGAIKSLNELKVYQGYYIEDTNNYTNTAKKIFSEALAEAAAYVKSITESDENKPTVTQVSSVSGVPKVESSGGKQSITIQNIKTIKLNNFSNNDESWFSFDKLAYKNLLENLGVNSQPVISSIIIDGKAICDRSNCNSLLGVNLFTKSSTINTIEIAIDFTGYQSSNNSNENVLKCGSQPMEYYLTYSYYDEKFGNSFINEYKDYLGIVWYSGKTNVDTGASTQRFITIENLTGGSGGSNEGEKKYESGKIEDSVTLIGPCSCYDLYDECMAEINKTGDMYGAACQELYESGCCVEIGEKCEAGNEIACQQYDEFCTAPKECDELDELCQAGDKDACDKYAKYCTKLKDCEDLNKECEQGNEEACQEYDEYCTEEGKSPYQCLTTVENFDCCDADNNLIISTLDNHEVKISGPEDVYTCFVSQIDKQVSLNGDKGTERITGTADDENNSYTLIDDNKYCLVSCKEDYIMTMPTAKLVNAGRYFTFSAAVDGTKTCYTNTINRELYNKDIIDAQKNLADTYNTYRKWYELYHNGNITPVSSSYPSSCTCDSHGCGPSCSSSSYYPNWKATATVNDWQTVISENEANGQISINVWANGVSASYVYEETIGAQTYSCPGGSWTTTSCSGTGTNRTCSTSHHSCSGGSSTYYTGTRVVHTEADFRNYLKGQMDNAEKALKDAQDKYKNIISQYNGCSDWDMNIEYEPEIYYDYEEDYIADKYNNYGDMDLIMSGTSKDNWYCNSNVSSSGYENKANLIGTNYDKCTNSTSDNTIYTQMNYMYCTTSGCSLKHENISNARYKKMTSTISAKYVPSTLFYNVYPSGEILDKDEGENNENAVALENELPVSLNTKRGIYKYTVNMKNLGEFYNQDGKLGRLIGGNTAVINKKDYADYVNDNGYVEYACSYLVNMGITEEDTIVCDFDTTCKDGNCIADCIGPNCDKDCDGDDCIADCIGAGCIYDSNAGTSLLEKVVSLNNLFPNGTNSYNWNRDANTKASTTIEEIEEAGESVFDSEPILSVTITPSVAKAIKEYNDDAESDGGYSNNTLSCYALGGYEEIACYSNFISNLIGGKVTYEGTNYINNSSIVNNRSLIMGNNYRTVTDENTKYFTTWSTDISEDKMIGPSWK